jgi:hypothetical protein
MYCLLLYTCFKSRLFRIFQIKKDSILFQLPRPQALIKKIHASHYMKGCRRVCIITLQGMEKWQCALRRSYHNEDFILTICSYGKFFKHGSDGILFCIAFARFVSDFSYELIYMQYVWFLRCQRSTICWIIPVRIALFLSGDKHEGIYI